MPNYMATFTPIRTPGGRHRSHLRKVVTVFTAPNREQAERRTREFAASMFVRVGDAPDFTAEVEQL